MGNCCKSKETNNYIKQEDDTKPIIIVQNQKTKSTSSMDNNISKDNTLLIPLILEQLENIIDEDQIPTPDNHSGLRLAVCMSDEQRTSSQISLDSCF